MEPREDPVGSRASILFEGEGWYHGVVSAYKSELSKGDKITRRIKIAYDDGTTSPWLDPAAEQEAGQLKFEADSSAGPSKRVASSSPTGDSKRQKPSAMSGAASSSSAVSVAPSAVLSVAAAAKAQNSAVVIAPPARALGSVPTKPRDLVGKTNSESGLLAGPAAGQKGITREALAKHAVQLGLLSAATQGAICTKGGVVSHIVLNEEFNDLAPSPSDVQEFWVSDGTERNKNAQLLNPTGVTQSSIPIFWVADKQNRKGGVLAVYVGHFTAVRVSTFHTLVRFKKADRKSLVELRFDRFDGRFAKNVDGVSDGEGVSSKVKSKVKSEVKSEVSGQSASASAGSGGKAKATIAGPQQVLIEFKFKSHKTYLVGAGDWEGVLQVPMLQDQVTGRCKLRDGTTTAHGKVTRKDHHQGYHVQVPESFTATFEQNHGQATGLRQGFNLGYTLHYLVEQGEEGVEYSIRPNGSAGPAHPHQDFDSAQFECYGPKNGKEASVQLAAWEKNAGGMLNSWAFAEFDAFNYDDGRSNYGSDNDSGDASMKIKLYTVLSAHQPTSASSGKVKQPKYDVGAAADWDALTQLVGARFPKKNAVWAAKAVQQYQHFIALKIEHNDWESELFSPSTSLDEVWHAHLAFVDRYQADILALTQGARHVIEHSPVLGPVAKGRYAACYKAHVERMRRSGTAIDKEFWPEPKDGDFKVPRDNDSDDHLSYDGGDPGSDEDGPVCG